MSRPHLADRGAYPAISIGTTTKQSLLLGSGFLGGLDRELDRVGRFEVSEVFDHSENQFLPVI